MSTSSTTNEHAAPTSVEPPWWIYIWRQYSNDLAVGPYPSEDVVNKAFQDSLLIDGFCEEDCLDTHLSTDEPDDTFERVLIDPQDPDHFGR